tara:strand:- start:6082 stop:6957 length:876 start_codon:yes stop_codon:yes gene_type:complete
MRLNLLKTFIKVADLGSLTKAAQQLHQPKSRVSRSLARLEEDLGFTLMNRTTRSLSLTEEGRRLYQQTHTLLNDLESRLDNFSKTEEEPSGTLSISAPTDFAQNFLPSLLCLFSESYPHLQYRIHLSDDYVDLAAYDIDVAFRAGNLKDSSLKQKKISISQLILVASKDYLNIRGRPDAVAKLKQHAVFSYYNENTLDPLMDIYKRYQLQPTLRSNSFPLLKAMALEGKGIAILPDITCRKELREKTLEQVLPTWHARKGHLQLVYSAQKKLPPKLRCFIDFVAKNIDSIY